MEIVVDTIMALDRNAYYYTRYDNNSSKSDGLLRLELSVFNSLKFRCQYSRYEHKPLLLPYQHENSIEPTSIAVECKTCDGLDPTCSIAKGDYSRPVFRVYNIEFLDDRDKMRIKKHLNIDIPLGEDSLNIDIL